MLTPIYSKPSNKKFKQVFDSAADKYDEFTNSYSVQRRVEFIKKYANGKCLEIGAGSGEISKSLISSHEVVATDISPKMVEVIKNKLKIKAYASDAEKLPFKNSSFDTVVAAEVIYYLDHPEKFISEANRLLKSGGRILITSASKITEIYDRIRAMLRKIGFSSMYFEDPNRTFMSRHEIEKLLVDNGFKIKKTQMAILLPFKIFDQINRLLEKTPLKYLGCFIFVYAKKLQS